ncbi:MAG: diguanylate cyclase [Gordonibacter pamelaeae]
MAIENRIRSAHSQQRPIFAQTLCYFFMTTVHRIENEHHLTLLSFHDALTGLYNRNRYRRVIAFLGARAGPLGVLFIDVNDLKVVNDRYGHECGDRLAHLRGEDDARRVGGAEPVPHRGRRVRGPRARCRRGVPSALWWTASEQGVRQGRGRRSGPLRLGGDAMVAGLRRAEAVAPAADAQDMYERKRMFHAERALATR